MAKQKKQQLKVMVSSSVYGIEELLERIFSILTEMGYEVWMSHKGTLPVFSNQTAFQNCMDGVERCDLFLSIITQRYGSGVDEAGGLSITHKELLHAIELNKTRWILAHDHVVAARSLLQALGYETSEQRRAVDFKKRNPVIDDIKIIDMYEAAIRHDVNMPDRAGNWVQKFINKDDALLYAQSQFGRYQEVEQFIKEQFGNHSAVKDSVERRITK